MPELESALPALHELTEVHERLAFASATAFLANATADETEQACRSFAQR